MKKHREFFYNHLYPFHVWIMTIAIGTILRTMTMGSSSVKPTGGSVFVNELLLGIEYSILTLSVCYIAYIILIRTEIHYMVIKALIAITGVTICTMTIMMKYQFGFIDLTQTANLTLISAYNLPLIAGCLLLRIKSFNETTTY